ncbi:MAG TPA: dienelactone hydrolase family protein [Longimicrobiales bacterium]|nr:dienelactone hydrolase family protein [Longimicrobiales bacterium]
MIRVNANDPHAGQPTLTGGVPLEEARGAMVMLHGRGATAESILALAEVFGRPDFAYLAPAAAGNAWYPHSFLAPIDRNEPWLSSALAFVGRALEQALGAGLAPERLMLLGFSQGACLTLEYVAQHARRYGGVAGLTGGLIGPDGTPRDYRGSLAGTPVFIGSADPDPHIPRERVVHSAAVLERMGAEVTTRIYPGMGHTVNEDEVEHVRALMEDVLAR